MAKDLTEQALESNYPLDVEPLNELFNERSIEPEVNIQQGSTEFNEVQLTYPATRRDVGLALSISNVMVGRRLKAILDFFPQSKLLTPDDRLTQLEKTVRTIRYLLVTAISTQNSAALPQLQPNPSYPPPLANRLFLWPTNSSTFCEMEGWRMSNPNELTESENAVLRLIAAFAQLPNSRIKLSKEDREALQSAQDKLNQSSW